MQGITVTGASTRWTLLSSTKISRALAHNNFTSLSLMHSHFRNKSIWRSKSDIFRFDWEKKMLLKMICYFFCFFEFEFNLIFFLNIFFFYPKKKSIFKGFIFLFLRKWNFQSSQINVKFFLVQNISSKLRKINLI